MKKPILILVLVFSVVAGAKAQYLPANGATSVGTGSSNVVTFPGYLEAVEIGPVLQCDQSLFTAGAADVAVSENNCNTYAINHAYLGYTTIDLRLLLAGSHAATSGTMHVGSTSGICPSMSGDCGITAILPQNSSYAPNFFGGPALSAQIYYYNANNPTNYVGRGANYNTGDLIQAMEAGYGYTNTANNAAIFEVTSASLTGGGASYAASTTYTTATVGPGTGLTVQVNVTSGVVTGVSSIVSCGANYNNSDVATVNGGNSNAVLLLSASGGCVTSATVATGVVNTILGTPVNPVTGAVTSGTFTAGETVTQTGTGATATLVEVLSYGTNPPLVIDSIAGTPNATGTWVGGTSGAVFTPTAAPMVSSGYLSSEVVPTQIYWSNGSSAGTGAAVSLTADASAIYVGQYSVLKGDSVGAAAATFSVNPTATNSAGFALDSGILNTGYSKILGGVKAYGAVSGSTGNPTYGRAEIEFFGEDQTEGSYLVGSGRSDNGVLVHGCCGLHAHEIHHDIAGGPTSGGATQSTMLRIGLGDTLLNVCTTTGSNVLTVPYGNATLYNVGSLVKEPSVPSFTIVTGLKDSRDYYMSNVATATTGGQTQCSSPTTTPTKNTASSGIVATLFDPADTGDNAITVDNVVVNARGIGMPAIEIGPLVAVLDLGRIYQEAATTAPSVNDQTTPEVVVSTLAKGVHIHDMYGHGSEPLIGNLSQNPICVDNIFSDATGAVPYITSPNNAFGSITGYAPTLSYPGGGIGTGYIEILSHFCEGDTLNRSGIPNALPDTGFKQGSAYWTNSYSNSSVAAGAGVNGSSAAAFPLTTTAQTGVLNAGTIPNFPVNVPIMVGVYIDASQVVSGTVQYGFSSAANYVIGYGSNSVSAGYKGISWFEYLPNSMVATPWFAVRASIVTGSGGIASGTYSNTASFNLTVTGNPGDTVVLSSFNGATGTTCTLALSATNTIATGTPCSNITPGSGVTAAPTYATTCTVGTAASCALVGANVAMATTLPTLYVSEPFVNFNSIVPAYNENDGGWLTAPGAGSLFSSARAAGAAGALGYATGTGAGCAATQGTSRTTGVTCAGNTGAITLFSAAGSATAATFTVTDSDVAATDTVQISQKSGTNLYETFSTAVTAGTFNVTFFTTGGTATDAPVFNFTVIKGSAN